MSNKKRKRADKFLEKPKKKFKSTLLKDTHENIYKEALAGNNPGIDLEKVTTASCLRLNFKCLEHKECDGHTWTTRVNHRTYKNATKCPFCSNKRYCPCSPNYGGLKKAYPDIFAQIDRKMNIGIDFDNIATASNIKLWFRCPNSKTKCDHHIWKTVVATRTWLKCGCPFCCDPPQQYCECMRDQTLASRPDMIADILST